MNKNSIVRVLQDGRPVGSYYRISSFEGGFAYCQQIVNGQLEEDHIFVYSKRKLKQIPAMAISISQADYNNMRMDFPTIIRVPHTAAWEKLVVKLNSDPNIILNLHFQDKGIYIRLSSAVRTGKFKEQPTVTLFDTKLI